ncbi:unnamed protein product [Pedinophyceae sp. YPF-701]|nr:unnamed protein product [Pedinophyceae sp. YPF-701]
MTDNAEAQAAPGASVTAQDGAPQPAPAAAAGEPANGAPPGKTPAEVHAAESKRRQEDEILQRARRVRQMKDAVVALLVSKEMVPAFLSQLNTLRGAQDETGASALPWAQWNRAWAAHENRHCDVLKRWLYLSGRADVRAVEVHVHALMQAGLDTGAEGLPYAGLISAAFQVRRCPAMRREGEFTRRAKARRCVATQRVRGRRRVSLAARCDVAAQERWHSRAFYALSKAAEAGGGPTLAKACRAISEDEKRQEVALSSAVTRLFEADPEGAVIAMARAHQDGRLGALGSLRAAQRTIEAPTSGAVSGSSVPATARVSRRSPSTSRPRLSGHAVCNVRCCCRCRRRWQTRGVRLSAQGAGAVARSLEWIRGAWGALEGIEGLQGDVEDVRAFIEAWGVPVRAVSSTQAAAAQDYLLEVDSEW